MKTINDQPQELLARYAERKGSKFELYMERFDIWREPVLEHETPQWCLDNRFPIRLVLTHGLPSHLPPYKENPRDPGEGYRVSAWGESVQQPHEMFLRETRVKNPRINGVFSEYCADYRIPATVMPPDWEEMTREVAVQLAVETPDLQTLKALYAKAGEQLASMEIELAQLRSKQPTIGVLRPIAEMPDEVPEGCERMFGVQNQDGTLRLGDILSSGDTFCIDIIIPNPDAALKAEWEALFTQDQAFYELRKTLTPDQVETSFNAFKSSKKP